jgi:5-methylcytosine-specific restriction endonuclease McrA
LLAKTLAKRNIPVSIRREVWARDAGRCTYQSREGRCCGSRETIEFHHQIPWARCKEHKIENIALRCRAHNQYEAESDFGTAHMARFRREVEVR